MKKQIRKVAKNLGDITIIKPVRVSSRRLEWIDVEYLLATDAADVSRIKRVPIRIGHDPLIEIRRWRARGEYAVGEEITITRMVGGLAK